MADLICDISTGEEIIDEINRQADLYRGIKWNSATNYQAGDVATRKDKVYVALVDNTNEDPASSPSWILPAIVEQGGLLWAYDINYSAGTLVTENETAYVAISDNVNKPPQSNPDVWQVISGSGNAVWGQITGDITQQTDLFNNFEEHLGYPVVDGQVLASLMNGTRQWIQIDSSSKPYLSVGEVFSYEKDDGTAAPFVSNPNGTYIDIGSGSDVFQAYGYWAFRQELFINPIDPMDRAAVHLAGLSRGITMFNSSDELVAGLVSDSSDSLYIEKIKAGTEVNKLTFEDDGSLTGSYVDYTTATELTLANKGLVDTKEDYLGLPATDGQILTSLADGTREWQPIDLGKPHFEPDEYMTATYDDDATQKVFGLNAAGNQVYMGTIDLPTGNVGLHGQVNALDNLSVQGNNVYHEGNLTFIEAPTGGDDSGKAVLLNSSGIIDPNFIEINSLTPIGDFTPTDAQPYPDTTGLDYGSYWSITGLPDDGYTYTTGDLTGETVYNADNIVYGQSSWYLVQSSLDPEEYMRLDKTRPMIDNGRPLVVYGRITYVEDGTADLEAVNLKQLNTKADLVHTHTASDITDFDNAVSLTTDVSDNTAARHTHSNFTLLETLTDTGDGSNFLADDGTYKPVGSGGSVEWGAITGDINNQTDLVTVLDAKANEEWVQTELDLKEDYLGNPTTDSQIKVFNSDGTQVYQDIPGAVNPVWGNIEGDINNQTDLQDQFATKSDVGHEHNSIYFQKGEFLSSPSGGDDSGMPILLDATGKIDSAFINTAALTPVGTFTPDDTTPYPDTTGYNYGSYWVMDGLTDAGYTYSTGDLSGKTVYNGDAIVYGQNSWYLITQTITPEDYLRLDGTSVMQGTLNMGTNSITNVVAGVNANDAVNVSQLADYAPTDHDHVAADITDFDTAVSANQDVTDNTAARHTHSNLPLLETIIDTGDGSNFLSDDGTYKPASDAGIPDAPSDGTVYGRQDASWVNVPAIGHTHTISDVNGLQDELNSKADIIHTHNISDVAGLQDELDLKMEASDVFQRSEFIQGYADPGDDPATYQGLPIILDVAGKISEDFIDNSPILVPIGPHTPTSTNEYPDTTDVDPGGFWTIEGLDSAGYEFTTGDLAGQTIYNSDHMIFGVRYWYIVNSSLDPAVYVLVNGESVMTGNLNLGLNRVINVMDGVNNNDAVNVVQLATKADVGHDHDADYALIVHTHVEADITDLDKYTQQEVDDALALKQDDLGLGTAGQVLVTNAGATDTEWADLSVEFANITGEVSDNPALVAAFDAKENYLDVPDVDGYVLSSTTTGERSWIEMTGSVEEAPLDGQVYGRSNASWTPVSIGSHTHAPEDIVPQGSGSGLDADTVDGIEGSQIITTAGGDITGNLGIDGILDARGGISCTNGITVTEQGYKAQVQFRGTDGEIVGTVVYDSDTDEFLVLKSSGTTVQGGLALESDGNIRKEHSTPTDPNHLVTLGDLEIGYQPTLQWGYAYYHIVKTHLWMHSVNIEGSRITLDFTMTMDGELAVGTMSEVYGNDTVQLELFFFDVDTGDYVLAETKDFGALPGVVTTNSYTVTKGTGVRVKFTNFTGVQIGIGGLLIAYKHDDPNMTDAMYAAMFAALDRMCPIPVWS